MSDLIPGTQTRVVLGMEACQQKAPERWMSCSRAVDWQPSEELLATLLRYGPSPADAFALDLLQQDEEGLFPSRETVHIAPTKHCLPEDAASCFPPGWLQLRSARPVPLQTSSGSVAPSLAAACRLSSISARCGSNTSAVAVESPLMRSQRMGQSWK